MVPEWIPKSVLAPKKMGTPMDALNPLGTFWGIFFYLGTTKIGLQKGLSFPLELDAREPRLRQCRVLGHHVEQRETDDLQRPEAIVG